MGFTLIRKGGIHLGRCALGHSVRDVRVPIQRRAGTRVPEHGLDHLRVNPVLHRQGRRCVPQIVDPRPGLRDPRLSKGRHPYAPTEVGSTDDASTLRGENQAVRPHRKRRQMSSQRIHNNLGQLYRPTTTPGLGRPDCDLASNLSNA
jgi:hypothetical protein